MVTVFQSDHTYGHTFETATVAYFDRYPNPYAPHVVSCDVVSHILLRPELLKVERLIHKRGSLPRLLRPLLGHITDTWIMETSLVDSSKRTLRSWSRNLDHRTILRVDDTSVYTDVGDATRVSHNVSFVSNMKLGIKDKIEQWGKKSFGDRIGRSREGMVYAMERLRHATRKLEEM